jgi:hypothetical protein
MEKLMTNKSVVHSLLLGTYKNTPISFNYACITGNNLGGENFARGGSSPALHTHTKTKDEVVPVLRSLDIWGSGGIASPFITSALDGSERSFSHLG